MTKKQQETKKDEEYDNSLTGALFFNEQKQKPNHPDFNGSMVDENGKEFWIAGWKKLSKGGKKYISLSFSEKEETTETDDKKVSKDDPW